MNPNTGNVVVDGIVQIAVATLSKSEISPDKVPEFLKSLGQTLVDCIKDAEAAASSPAQAPAVQPTTASAPSTPAAQPVEASAPSTPAAAATAPVAVAAASEAVSAAPAAPAKRRGRPPKAAAAVQAGEVAQTAVAPQETAATVANVTEAISGEAPSAETPTFDTSAEEADVQGTPAEVVLSDDPADENYRFAHISRVPVVPVEKSVKDDGIVCLIDGVERMMLKRHIRSNYGMEPAQYRRHFNLPKDYPLRAPGYAKEKSLVALAQGLGKKTTGGRKKKAVAQETPAAKVRKRTRTPARAAA